MAQDSEIQPNPLPPEFIEKWIDNQSKEIETRRREIELRAQTDKNQFEYAKLALNVQANDTKKERDHESKQHSKKLIFAGIMVGALLGFLVYSLHTGKDQVALEILKAAIFIASGGFGGYALGTRQSQDKKTGKQ